MHRSKTGVLKVAGSIMGPDDRKTERSNGRGSTV